MPALLAGMAILAFIGWLVGDGEPVSDVMGGTGVGLEEEADLTQPAPAQAPASLGAVIWADVPFVDGTGSKTRPVVVHHADDDGLLVSPLYSKPSRHPHSFRMRIDADTAASFDAKGCRGYVEVTDVRLLPWESARPGLRTGRLSCADLRRLNGHRSEWLP